MKLSNLQNAKTAIKNKNNFFVIMIQARRAGCSCMRRYRRSELVAVACTDTGTASWLQLHAQIQARQAGCSCMRRYRHHAF
jgi:hypothetical protein